MIKLTDEKDCKISKLLAYKNTVINKGAIKYYKAIISESPCKLVLISYNTYPVVLKLHYVIVRANSS